MGDIYDRGMERLAKMFGGSPPEEPAPPPPNFNLGALSPYAPPTSEDDLYIQPGGGFGSRAADVAEAQRVAMVQQRAEAEHDARVAERQGDPEYQRAVEFERLRRADLERRRAAGEVTKVTEDTDHRFRPGYYMPGSQNDA